MLSGEKTTTSWRLTKSLELQASQTIRIGNLAAPRYGWLVVDHNLFDSCVAVFNGETWQHKLKGVAKRRGMSAR